MLGSLHEAKRASLKGQKMSKYANHSWGDIKTGNRYQNMANTRKVEIADRTHWRAGAYNTGGFFVIVTEKDGSSFMDRLTPNQIVQRFPIEASKQISALEAEVAELEAHITALKKQIAKAAK